MKEGRFGLFAPIKVNSKSHSSLLATMMGSVVAYDSTVFKLDSNASFTKKSDRQTDIRSQSSYHPFFTLSWDTGPSYIHKFLIITTAIYVYLTRLYTFMPIKRQKKRRQIHVG